MQTESQTRLLTFGTLTGPADLCRREPGPDVLLIPGGEAGRYCAGFAVSEQAIEQALRLRYEIFNLELGEGLESSNLSGLDRDAFDDQMSHLVLMSRDQRLVGTYRIQTASHALASGGLYSASEFDLAGLAELLPESIELGRACLAKDHRNFAAIYTLWLGIGAFMNLFNQRYLFGCCSLTTTDTDDGWRALKTIRANGHLHNAIFLPALDACACGDPARERDPALGDAIPLPKLFRTYMRLGTRVISEPAIDRAFGTVDFLAMLDGKHVAMAGLDVLK